MSVDTERLERVLLITMRREHKRNAIDASITAGLDAALNDLQDDPGLWCGILSGGPTVFSAGADLAALVATPTVAPASTDPGDSWNGSLNLETAPVVPLKFGCRV